MDSSEENVYEKPEVTYENQSSGIYDMTVEEPYDQPSDLMVEYENTGRAIGQIPDPPSLPPPRSPTEERRRGSSSSSSSSSSSASPSHAEEEETGETEGWNREEEKEEEEKEQIEVEESSIELNLERGSPELDGGNSSRRSSSSSSSSSVSEKEEPGKKPEPDKEGPEVTLYVKVGQYCVAFATLGDCGLSSV